MNFLSWLSSSHVMHSEAKEEEEAGYMLLEVLIATAVAASVVSLLLTALTGLGKAQTRIGTSTAVLSEQIFDEALLSSIFENLRPGYYDEEVKFTGEKMRLSGKTFLDGYNGKGRGFSLSLQSNDQDGVDLVLQLESDIQILSRFSEGKYAFNYQDHFGASQDQWKPLLEEGMVDQKLKAQAPYSEMLPRQFQIVKTEGNDISVLLSYNLPYAVFPPQRPQDVILYLEGQL